VHAYWEQRRCPPHDTNLSCRSPIIPTQRSSPTNPRVLRRSERSHEG
jgi:hypothetical protein